VIVCFLVIFSKNYLISKSFADLNDVKKNISNISALDIYSNVPQFSSYGNENIFWTIAETTVAPMRLLTYFGNNIFDVQTIGSSEGLVRDGICGRCPVILSLLISTLKGTPLLNEPFKILFYDADFTYTTCTQVDCTNKTFAPFLHFGSFLRKTDATLNVPKFQIFPVSDFLRCIRDFQVNESINECQTWVPPYHPEKSWNTLIPKVIWRGSPFRFLETLSIDFFQNETFIPNRQWEPRKAIAELSLNNYSDWLDARWVRMKAMGIDEDEMSNYKYQIDLGGTSGTTWTGTFNKLAMPGVLFHHVTPAMDWYFGDIKAWVHYIPVRTDLSDLKEKYDWALEHDEKAKKISGQGTMFVKSFFSRRSLSHHLQSFFKESYLAKIINAYEDDASDHTYLTKQEGVYRATTANCTQEKCYLRLRKGWAEIIFNVSTCYWIKNEINRTRIGDPFNCF